MAVEFWKNLWLNQVALQENKCGTVTEILGEDSTTMNTYYNGLICEEVIKKNFWKLQEEIANLYRMVRELGFHKKSWHFMMLLQNLDISRIFIRMMNWLLWQRAYGNASWVIISIGRRKKLLERRCVRD